MLTLLLALAQQAIPQDSYADSATRVLVEHARAARKLNEQLITSYTATVSQRMGVGLQALARDRMLYRQEAVADIAWYRDKPSRIEFQGAREGVPVLVRGDMLPDLRDLGGSLVIDPASDYLRGLGGVDDQMILYPLSDGAEQSYRFARGESVTLTLPGGKQVTIISLSVLPRRADPKLMSGTLWFENETWNLVRAVYRPARPYETRRDAAHGDELPDWLNASLEVKFVTLEYGLYHSRWWMPRYIAFDGVGTMGAWLGVPFKLERIYRDYEVEGGTPPDSTSTFRPAGRKRAAVAARPGDSTAAARDSTDRGRLSDSTNLVVVTPTDTAALLTSPALGKPILQMGDLLSENELRQVGKALDRLPPRPWDRHIEVPKSVAALLRGARFNRVEGLSLGTGMRADFGRFALDGKIRAGIADGRVNGELSWLGNTLGPTTVTGYRRLAAANPEVHPFSALGSAQAFFFQRDDGEYFYASGYEALIDRSDIGTTVRLYRESQSTAVTETHAALPHLLSSGHHFRPNLVATDERVWGAAITLRTTKPLSRVVSIGALTTIDAARGEHDLSFARGSLTLRGVITPQHGPLSGAVTVAAGTSRGDVLPQSNFFLGGPATLRGHDGGAARGNAFWLARGEIGTAFPGARLVGFVDAGWAGDRTAFGRGTTLKAAGIGASLLDGLFRIDLARALRSGGGWRLEFSVDGAM